MKITLYQSPMFKVHLIKLMNKVSSCIALIRRLVRTKWGASFGVLRTSILALTYSSEEYYAPAWTQTAHAHKIDIPLNEAMRLVSGCLHSTPVSHLPFLCGIPPPQKCRDQICIKTRERGLGALTISFMSKMHLPVSRLKGPSDLLNTSN